MQGTLHRAGVSLRQTLASSHVFGASDVQVTSCCTVAEECQPGDLFVALAGADEDSHELAAEAVRRGASAILAERLLPTTVPVCVVPDSRDALGRVCQALAGHPSSQVQVIGVSGTNGKTTASVLIASVLRAADQRVGISTTLGRCDSFASAAANRTTPAGPELADWLARTSANRCSHAVLELSSRGLAQRRLAGVNLRAAVLTNLRRDHRDEHGSVRNYRRIKARMFEHLGPGGFAVINADDPASRFVLGQLQCPVMTVGMRQPAEVTGYVLERHRGEQTFLLSAGSETVPVRTRMIGDHHVSNCLAATAVGLVMGLDLTTIARGLERVERLAARMDRIECGQDFGVYVDCADTPDRLAVSLRTLRQVTTGRVICVYGTDSHKRRSERPMLGRVAERAADLGIVTHHRLHGKQPLEVAHDVLDGYERPARAHVIPTRSQAIQWALSHARPGDSVLIAGNGRDGWAGGGPQGAVSEVELVRNWLYEATAGEQQAVSLPLR